MKYEKILFIHLPRTGGTFLSEYKESNFIYFGHAPATKLNAGWNGCKHKKKPEDYCIGFIRNPWDWYVSRYFYFLNRSQKVKERGLSKHNDAGLTSVALKQKCKNLKEHLLFGLEKNLKRFWLIDMYKYMFYENDVLLLNEIIKFENFQITLEELFKKLNI